MFNVKATQTELDLGKHFHNRLYKLIEDHLDTMDTAGIPRVKGIVIMSATMFDAACNAMLAADYKRPAKRNWIEQILIERFRVIAERWDKDEPKARKATKQPRGS